MISYRQADIFRHIKKEESFKDIYVVELYLAIQEYFICVNVAPKGGNIGIIGPHTEEIKNLVVRDPMYIEFNKGRGVVTEENGTIAASKIMAHLRDFSVLHIIESTLQRVDDTHWQFEVSLQ